MARISRVGNGWTAPEQLDWYATIEEWYNAEKGIDYGSAIEAVCKGVISDGGTATLEVDAVNGAWIYADPSVYYDFTNEDIIPVHSEMLNIDAFDIKISGIFLQTNGVSAGFEPIVTYNKRTIVEDCRIREMNLSGTAYGVQINGAGSQANQDVFLRCVIDRANTSATQELVKQAEANGYGALRSCVLDAGTAAKYVDGSNNVGLEVTDSVGLGAVGYDGASLILNTSSSEDSSSGTAGLTSIGKSALVDPDNGDWRTVSGGDLDTQGTNQAFVGAALNVAASDGITLTPFSSTGKMVFQRNIDNTPRSIDVTVNLTGDPSGGIEWRLVDAADDSVINGYDWDTFLANPSAGNTTQAITVPTGTVNGSPVWFKLEFRFTLDNLIIAKSVNAFGVGVNTSDYGQSNSEYRATHVSSNPPTPSEFVSYQNSGWQSSFASGDGAIQKANELVSLFNCPVGYMNAGSISKPIEHLTNGAGWVEFLAQIAYMNNEVELVVFDQGETDAKTPVSATDYQALSQSLFDKIKALSTFNNVNSIMGINYGGNSNNYSPAEYTDANIEGIRKGKVDFVNANANAIFVAHRIDLPLADTIHNSAEAYALVATRECYTYANFRGLSVESQKGRAISTIDVSGSNVTLNYESGPALTKIGTGASTATELSQDDFSSLLTITSTTVNDNSVIHTVSETITSTVKAREYYGAEVDVTTRPNLAFPSSAVATITSLLNLTISGLASTTRSVDFYNDATKAFIKTEEITFNASGFASVSLPLAVGVVVTGRYLGNNPPTTGSGIYGVTV